MSSWRVRIGRLLSIGLPLALGAGLLILSRGAKKPPGQIPTARTAPRVRVITLKEVMVVPRAVGYGVAMPKRTFRAVSRVEGETLQASLKIETADHCQTSPRCASGTRSAVTILSLFVTPNLYLVLADAGWIRAAPPDSPASAVPSGS